MRRLRSQLAGALVSLLVLAAGATGCGGSPEAAGGAGTPGTTAAADRVEPLPDTLQPRLPVTVRSADGLRGDGVRRTGRIVPLSGGLSEIVFTLGLGRRVVARDITATFQQAAKLPVVTRNHDVSAESVLSLKPDLVLAEQTTGPAEAMDQIRAAGVPVLVAPGQGPAESPRIRAVAGALGVPARRHGADPALRTAHRRRPRDGAAPPRQVPGRLPLPAQLGLRLPHRRRGLGRDLAAGGRRGGGRRGRVGADEGLHRPDQRGTPPRPRRTPSW